MSLERNSGTYTANCDFCSNYTDTEEVEFFSAVDRIKALGWQVFKKMGEWFHKCDACIAADTEGDFGDV